MLHRMLLYVRYCLWFLNRLYMSGRGRRIRPEHIFLENSVLSDSIYRLSLDQVSVYGLFTIYGTVTKVAPAVN